MTQLMLIELVQQHHPHMGETEIKLLLNYAQDLMVLETGGQQGVLTGTTVASTRDYAATDMVTIEDVYLKDSSGVLHKISRLLVKPNTEAD